MKKINNELVKWLIDEEGLKLKPYLDTKGYPTISVGVRFYPDGREVTMKDKPLTKEEAIKLFEYWLNIFCQFVAGKIKPEVNRNQFNACVSIAWNIGKKGFSESTFLKLINLNPNDKNIHKAIMLWTKDKELIPRRTREANFYFKK